MGASLVSHQLDTLVRPESWMDIMLSPSWGSRSQWKVDSKAKGNDLNTGDNDEKSVDRSEVTAHLSRDARIDHIKRPACDRPV